MIVRAFYERSEESSEESQKLIDYLKALTLEDIVKSPHQSVLDASIGGCKPSWRCLVALLRNPVFLCLYWIVRELYSVDYPDYGIGGARANPSGLVSAFTTSECVQAILSFQRVLKDTAGFFKQINEFVKASNHLNDMPPSLNAWSSAEKKRLELACQTTLSSLSGNLAFHLDKSLVDKEANEYMNYLVKQMKDEIGKAGTKLEGSYH